MILLSIYQFYFFDLSEMAEMNNNNVSVVFKICTETILNKTLRKNLASSQDQKLDFIFDIYFPYFC